MMDTAEQNFGQRHLFSLWASLPLELINDALQHRTDLVVEKTRECVGHGLKHCSNHVRTIARRYQDSMHFCTPALRHKKRRRGALWSSIQVEVIHDVPNVSGDVGLFAHRKNCRIRSMARSKAFRSVTFNERKRPTTA